MSSEIVLLREYKKDKPALKWCVYYEPDSGDVVTVTNKEKDFIKKPFIVTDSDDARLLLMGHKDPKKFAVVEVNHDLKLVEKSAVLRLKDAERKLSIIRQSNTSADVNIILYINHWKMEVNFSQDTLYAMTGKRFFRNISINPESEGKYDPITLYLTKKNDPNFLVMTMTIDPRELIDEGYLIFDMAPIRSICGLGDVSIMTKKIFNSYRMQRKLNFTGVDFRTRNTKRRNFTIPFPVTKDAGADFTIFKTDSNYIIRSNFGDPQQMKIYNTIGIYLTDVKNPNNLLGHLELPIEKLGWNGEIKFPNDIPLEECGFLCKDTANYLSFDYQHGEPNANTN